jgi:hypothetical protein
MSEKPINPLRQRMLDDMNMRRFTPDTQRDYVRAVKKLAAFLGRSPDTATAEDLRVFIANSTACRHLAMIQLLVHKRGIHEQTSGSIPPVSWNRSSSSREVRRSC